MHPVLIASFTVTALFSLSSCSTGMFSQGDTKQLERLESAMASCAITQGESQKQLKQQTGELVEHSRKLDDMSLLLVNALSEKTVLAVEIAPLPDVGSCVVPETEPTKLIVGRREQVWLEDFQLALPARVDTGAETASLDGRNIELFERNGKRWVRFDILHPQSGEAVRLEKRLKRIVSIVQSNSSEPERRPVIKLGIAIGSIKQSAEFTLSNRSHLDYQMLIGRNILKDVMIVDVSKTNVVPLVSDEQEH
ncbi:MAG: hypothetical protein ACJAZ0_001252 [Halioglobus sp.]|jgi:hypothetical protein